MSEIRESLKKSSVFESLKTITENIEAIEKYLKMIDNDFNFNIGITSFRQFEYIKYELIYYNNHEKDTLKDYIFEYNENYICEVNKHLKRFHLSTVLKNEIEQRQIYEWNKEMFEKCALHHIYVFNILEFLLNIYEIKYKDFNERYKIYNKQDEDIIIYNSTYENN